MSTMEYFARTISPALVQLTLRVQFQSHLKTIFYYALALRSYRNLRANLWDKLALARETNLD